MKIFLTGAGGQLGRALQEEIGRQSKHKVIALPRAQLDITKPYALAKMIIETKPDVIINAAAYNNVDQAETDKESAFAVNKEGPRHLASAAQQIDIPFIHVSTDYVFDGTKGQPYVESDKTHPLSVYAQSKEEGERAVLSVHEKSYVVRTAWVYYKGGKNFLDIMMRLKDKPEISVVSDQFSSPTYAAHLAQKLLMLLETKAAYGRYHMAGKGKASRFQMAEAFFKGMGIKVNMKPVSNSEFPQVAKRPINTVLATERGHQYELPPWEQSMEEYIKDLKNGM